MEPSVHHSSPKVMMNTFGICAGSGTPLRMEGLWRWFQAGERSGLGKRLIGRRCLPPPKGKLISGETLSQSCLNDARFVTVRKQMAGLRLDNRTDALKGGDSGPVIRPGSSGKSKLIQAVSGLGEGLLMPFAGERLTAEQGGIASLDRSGCGMACGAETLDQSPKVRNVECKSTTETFVPLQRLSCGSQMYQSYEIRSTCLP
jgi:hypothetical protein